MIFIVLALFAAFLGLCWELIQIGRNTVDQLWFKRLGFSEAAQDLSFDHVVGSIVAACVKFFFLVICTAIYVQQSGRPPTPLTPARVILSVLFVTAVGGLTGVSMWREYRRRKTREREISSATSVVDPASLPPREVTA